MKRRMIVLIAALSLQADKIAVIHVEGMTCPLCTVAVKKSLKKTPGVVKAKVKLSTSEATVRFKEDTDKKALLRAIEKVGYKGRIVKIENMKRQTAKDKRSSGGLRKTAPIQP